MLHLQAECIISKQARNTILHIKRDIDTFQFYQYPQPIESIRHLSGTLV